MLDIGCAAGRVVVEVYSDGGSSGGGDGLQACKGGWVHHGETFPARRARSVKLSKKIHTK